MGSYVNRIKIGDTTHLIEPTLYGTCSTAAATAAKTVTLEGFELQSGVTVAVKFTVTNTAASPTLSINSSDAKAIYYHGSAIAKELLVANKIYYFVYDGSHWEIIGDLDTDTDTKVTQTAVGSTYTYWRPLLFGASNSSSEGFSPSTVTSSVYATSALSVQPSTGTIRASIFKGSGESLTSLNASNISSGTLSADRLATSGATAGSYGPSAAISGTDGTTMNVPYITVDNKGRITGIENKVYTSVNTWRPIGTGATDAAAGNHNHNSNYVQLLSSSTDNAVVRFNGTSGQVQNSGVIIDDNNNIIAGSNKILNNSAQGQGEILLSVLGFKTGYPIYTDPTFLSGYNSISIYNNSGNGTVVHTRNTYSNFNIPSPGTDSNYVLQIKTTGNASPNCGGFYLTISARANAQFIQIFRALVPDGRYLYLASNPMGTTSKDEWLTSNAGTGKWEWYARRVICGQEGSMSSGGHISIGGAAGTSENPVIWYLSFCNVYDITKAEYDGLKTRFADAANLTSTQYGLAYYSDTTGTFAGTDAGTSGQYLKSNGTSAPTWASFPSTWTPSSHTHGNITNDGKLSGSTVSGAVTTTHKFLREDGTWVVPAYLTIGTTSSTAMAGNTVVTNVTQTGNTEDKEFSILLKNTNNTTDETAGTKFGKTTDKLVTVNPSTGTISAASYKGSWAGNTIGASYGGTGKTTLQESANALINALSTGDSNTAANDYIITQYAYGGTTHTTYHRRPASKVVNATLVKAALETNSTHGYTFLRKDGTWQTPPYPVTSVNNKTGAVTISAEDLGLSSAMHFRGKATVAITENSTTDPTISGYTFGTNGASALAGDVILDKDSEYEYVWTADGTNGKWEKLGSSSSYALSNHNHDDTYLKLAGGKMTGPLTWKDGTALPEATTISYLLGIDAFANGGTTKWISAANARTSIGAAASNHTHDITITQTGTSTVTLSAGTVYTLTAGGKSVVFTTPASSGHYTANIYTTGASGTSAVTTNTSDPYVALVENSTRRSAVQFKAGSNMSVSGNNGVITFTATNTWTAMTGATSSTNGTVGYVNAVPPKDGYNTKFLRADGTWAVPDYIANVAYGNISTSGTIGQSSGWALASGDGLVVFDSSNSNKLERTSITFDASTETQCLTKKGTWKTFGTSNLVIGTTSTTAMAGNTVVTNVTHTKRSDTTTFYLTGTTSSTTNTNGDIFDTGVYVTTTSGGLSAVRQYWNYNDVDKAYSYFNNTTQSIDFVFI